MSCHNLFCVFYAAGRTIVRSCHLQHSKQKKKNQPKSNPQQKKMDSLHHDLREYLTRAILSTQGREQAA